MHDQADTITIKLTPRAAAYLKTLLALYECHRNDAKVAHERDKEERVRAIQESRTADMMIGGPIKVPDPISIEDIAARALERGAAEMTANAASLRRPYHLGWCPTVDPVEVG